jgi:hypothetical protein
MKTEIKNPNSFLLFLFSSAFLRHLRREYPSRPGQGSPWWSTGRVYHMRFQVQSVTPIRCQQPGFPPKLNFKLLLRDEFHNPICLSPQGIAEHASSWMCISRVEMIYGVLKTYVVSGEMVDIALSQHGVVFELGFPKRGSVAYGTRSIFVIER